MSDFDKERSEPVRGSVADVVLGDRGEGRQVRGAAVIALLVHFLLFALVLPYEPRVFDMEAEAATVIRRYKPPKPPEITKPRRKQATRVPIPDATPYEPEPLMDEEEIVPPPVAPSTNYVLGAPVGLPDPPEIRNAIDMDTEGLAPPRLLHRVRPRYDPQRARRGVQGKVDLQIVIDVTGTVAFARVLNGTEDDILDETALAAVQQWEFAPATLGGDPVAVRATVTINYRIY